MDMEYKYLLMEIHIKGNTEEESSMVKENIHG